MDELDLNSIIDKFPDLENPITKYINSWNKLEIPSDMLEY